MLSVRGKHATADVWVTRRKKSVTFLVTNWALPEHPIQTEVLRLELRGAKRVATANVERIDEEHANPRRAWEKMGRPESLSPREVEALELASELTKRPIAFQRDRGAIVFDLPMAPQGTALVTMELE
jgi:xylan 1,4-beta-xylosidase